MTFKQKRRSKKLAIIYSTLAYVMIAMFITLVVLSGTGVIDLRYANPQYTIWIIFAAVSPLFFSLFFMMFSGWSSMKRTAYKFKIRMYREYRHFNTILDYLEAGKIEEARNLLNSLPQGNLRVFTNGFLMAYSIQSTDAKINAKAQERLNELREDFCHHNVKF